MHYLNGTGLLYAPLTCIVHHGAQGGPMVITRRSDFNVFAALSKPHELP